LIVIIINPAFSENDISKIAEFLNVEGLDNQSISKLYQEIDLNNDGKVSMDEFVLKTVDVIEHRRTSNFGYFFNKIDDCITNKANMIIRKLKNIKNIPNIDEKIADEVDW
jgi:Ca2+-binding EF-hand superfamily protein